jgi:hypothetical protein
MAEMSGFSYSNAPTKTSNGPMIAGVVAGLIVGLCVLVGAFLYGRRKSRRRNQERDIELGHASNSVSRRRKPSEKGGGGDSRKNPIANSQVSTSSKAERVKPPSRQQKREEMPASGHEEGEEIPVSRYPAI